MVNLNGFNANEHESQDFDVIPKGDYTVVIADSELKQTNAGDGSYIQFTLEVVDGPFKGRKVWDIMCTDHPNEKTVIIARARLADYCRAVGKPAPKDTGELHNIPLRVRVGVKKDKDGTYEDRNRITSVLWKETTKPNIAGIAGGGEQTQPRFLSEDVPF